MVALLLVCAVLRAVFLAGLPPCARLVKWDSNLIRHRLGVKSAVIWKSLKREVRCARSALNILYRMRKDRPVYLQIALFLAKEPGSTTLSSLLGRFVRGRSS